MGSSKSANALMARFNYEERGQKALMVKPRLDARDGEHMVYSRIGLTYPCVYFDEMQEMSVMELQQNACIIVDEAQFLTREEVMYLVDLVDQQDIPVMCYGLRADFKGPTTNTSASAAATGWRETWARTLKQRPYDLQPLSPGLPGRADPGPPRRRMRHAVGACGGPGDAPPVGGALPDGGARGGSRLFLRL